MGEYFYTNVDYVSYCPIHDIYYSDGPCPLCQEGMVDNKEGGKKYDKGKLRWDLLPFDVIEDIVDIITYGAEKYEPNNWQKVESWRYIGALFRHVVAWLKGEGIDKESGRHHLAHALCNLVFLLWKEKNEIKEEC